VEQLIALNNIKTIYASYFSSAFVNFKLMYGDLLKITLICNEDVIAVWRKYIDHFNINVIEPLC